MNFVFPGMATGGVAAGPNSTFSGMRFSCEFIALSHVMTCPVYAAIRPMINMSVLLAMRTPSLITLPARMDANSSSCSVWWPAFCGPSYFHGFSPVIVHE